MESVVRAIDDLDSQHDVSQPPQHGLSPGKVPFPGSCG